jgi:thioredoxin 1
MISQVTIDNYKEIFSRQNTILVIEFYRKSCGHCMMLQQELNSLSEDQDDVLFGKVDIEEQPFFLKEYDIMSVPTIMFIKNGAMKEKLIGYYPKIIITENLKKIK